MAVTELQVPELQHQQERTYEVGLSSGVLDTNVSAAAAKRRVRVRICTERPLRNLAVSPLARRTLIRRATTTGARSTRTQ
jgi:hypothetical protein